MQPLFAGVFVFVSGMVCNISRSNLRRGLKTFALGMALTLGTLLAMPDQLIAFGILHFMGAAMLLFAIVLTITCINLLVSKKHVHY